MSASASALAPPPPPVPASRISCRPLRAADAPAAVALLTRGFPSRSADYWRRALDRLARHASGTGTDSFGVLLENDGMPVGVLLLIRWQDAAVAGRSPRCNVSSWYVEPAFQAYSPLLVARAARERGVTLFNISPAVHVRPIIEAQGFRRYGSGRFWCCPALGAPRRGVRVRGIDALSPGWADRCGITDPRERHLIEAHAEYGCISLAVSTPDDTLPFVLLPRMTKGVLPTAQLVYCRSLTEFVRLSGPIGRHLAARGLPLVSIDTDGAIPGLVGRFATDGCPKYFKGTEAPRLGDMSYTELVMFGP